MGNRKHSKGKVKAAFAVLIFVILSFHFAAGCGGAGEEETQRLVDIYVEYLDTDDPMLLEEIGDLCPRCLFEDGSGRHVDEGILLMHVKDHEVDLSALEEARACVFDSDRYPLHSRYAESYYIEPVLEEDVGKVSVNFTLEGPWDLSQRPEHPEDSILVSLSAASDVRHHDRFPQATYAVQQFMPGGMITRFVSKDENALYEYGTVGDLFNVIEQSAPNTVIEFPIEVGNAWKSVFEASLDGARSMDVSVENRVISKGVIFLPDTAFLNAYLVQSKWKYEREGERLRENIAYTWYVPDVGEVAYILSTDDKTDETFTKVAQYHRLIYIR